MAFTTAELNLVNQALGRIGAKRIESLSDSTSPSYVLANLFYTQTRDALARSIDFPLHIARETLDIVKTLTVEYTPVTSAWVAGDVLTGIDSGTTATVISVTSETEYEISDISGDFTAGETITDGTVEKVYWQGQQVFYGDETVYWWDSATSNYAIYSSIATSAPAFQWTYKYKLPSDFLRLKSIYENDGYDDPIYRYHIEGGYILTDYDTLNVRYIKKVTDPAYFDPLFTECLVLRLSLKLLSPAAGTETNQIRQGILQELSIVEARARSIAASEKDSGGYSSWNNARFTSGKI
jgi:hypothetical protein